MKRNEVSAVLTAIRSFNQWQEMGIDVEDAWFEAVDSDMDAMWAIRSVNGYYGDPQMKNRQILPSELNREWRAKRQQAREEDQWERQRNEQAGETVRHLMPSWFADAMTEAFGGVTFDGVREGGGTQEIFDRHAATVGIDLNAVRTTLLQDDHASNRHCGVKDCMCSHSHGCFKGWIDQVDGPSRPCPVCKEDLAQIISEIPAPGHRSIGDYARVQSRFRGAGDHA